MRTRGGRHRIRAVRGGCSGHAVRDKFPLRKRQLSEAVRKIVRRACGRSSLLRRCGRPGRRAWRGSPAHPGRNRRGFHLDLERVPAGFALHPDAAPGCATGNARGRSIAGSGASASEFMNATISTAPLVGVDDDRGAAGPAESNLGRKAEPLSRSAASIGGGNDVKSFNCCAARKRLRAVLLHDKHRLRPKSTRFKRDRRFQATFR